MFQKLTPELRKKIEDSGLPLVSMTMEQFKESIIKANNKPKIIISTKKSILDLLNNLTICHWVFIVSL